MKRRVLDVSKKEFYQAIRRMRVVMDTDDILLFVQAFLSVHCTLDGQKTTIVGYEEHTEYVRIILMSMASDEKEPPGSMAVLNEAQTIGYGTTVRATAGGIIEYLDADGVYKAVPANAVISYDVDTRYR